MKDVEAEAFAEAAARIALPVTGMTCAGCARRVERALAERPGVVSAEVNAALERAEIAYDPEAVSPAELVEAVRGTGFGVRERALTLEIAGMSCAGCARRVERALAACPGVISAEVNVALERAELRLVPDAAAPAELIAAVEGAGFGARAPRDAASTAEDGAREARAARRERVELALSALLAAPFLIQMIAMRIDPAWRMSPWLELALATPILFGFGRRFHRGAWTALKAGAATMDTLVALGATAAWGFSLVRLVAAGPSGAPHLYFEAAAVIVTLVLAGKMLEARAKRSASAALRGLMSLRPERARLLRGGREVEVPAAEIEIGDVLVLRPGERAPADGVVIRGESEFDESLITGEPLPVPRREGDAVTAGAINGAGLIRVRAERVGADATPARIARLVERAQTGKAPVQRLVDRIAGVFVPAVLAISALTLAAWLVSGAPAESAFAAAVSVLVIACPCALGLATPTALVAGTGAAARGGVLIKDIEALERAARIDAVVFDKTGTLTRGAPEVAATEVFEGFEGGREALLALAGSVQAGSEHPLGRAMAAAAGDLPRAEVSGFRAVIGEGVEAMAEGATIRIGRAGFAAPEASAAQRARAEALAAGGRTVAWVARDGRPLGLIALQDALREDAAEAVSALQARGLRVVMLTGDSEAAARAVAARLGLRELRAELRPDGKAAAVEALRREGLRVAMVGDGINDAPALAAADLGIAMGGGADAAMETAGAALMRPRPALAAAALDIAQVTAARIRQNLFWAFVYNAVCIPVAALGWLNPAVAGAAMALSSLSVVANSLRLKSWRPEIAR